MKTIIIVLFFITTYSMKAQITVNYTYDNLNRLTQATYSNGKGIKYSYDALGNHTQEMGISNLSVEEVQDKSSLKLYPNPFADELNILSEKQSIKEVILLDISGKQIKHDNNLNTKAYKLSASHLPAGNYLVSVRTEEGVETYKVIKK